MIKNRNQQLDILTITTTPEYITCSLIRQSPASRLLQLIGHRSILLDDPLTYQGVIYQPTRIAEFIDEFRTYYHCKNALVAWATEGDGIFQNVQTLSTSSASLESFTLPKNKNFLCDYRYIAPHPGDGFDFYICGIKPEHLLHYQLFAAQANLDVILMTTPYISYIHAYQYQFGNAYRQAQLGLDAQRLGHNFANYFSSDFIARALQLTPEISSTLSAHTAQLAVSLGLFLGGKKQYEQH